jgi:Xaa-Pro aminopeptidase
LLPVGYDFAEQMRELLRGFGLGGRRVGFESSYLTVSTLLQWERALAGQVILAHTEGLVEQLRMVKDEVELAAIKKAAALADDAWAHMVGWLRPGLTENQISWELESYMRTHGADALAFTSIVASGPNSAKPHAGDSERVVQAGEPLKLDFGCVIDGYCSDITRTVSLGQPLDERYRAVWEIVRRANQTALAGVKAGVSGIAVDKLARDVITEAGYGDNFGHGLGHSLGLAVHENPRFSFTYAAAVPAGAVMTIEPGIYLPGWGGVRIEDMVLVTETGAELLTQAPRMAIIG